MIKRLSAIERTMVLQRLKETNERIADLEARIHRLKENGQPTVEAERLLRLLRRSRGMMRRYVDLLTRDQA